jgi:hypothetical protein
VTLPRPSAFVDLMAEELRAGLDVALDDAMLAEDPDVAWHRRLESHRHRVRFQANVITMSHAMWAEYALDHDRAACPECSVRDSEWAARRAAIPWHVKARGRIRVWWDERRPRIHVGRCHREDDCDGY